RQLRLSVVAVLPTTTYGGPDLLLPEGVVAQPVRTSASARTFVSAADGTADAAIRDAVDEVVPGTVRTVEEWVRQHVAGEQNTQLRIFTVLLGMASLYTLFAAINAVVIAAADRRSEFAAARLSGLTRKQVVRMAVLESATVTAVGVLLGGVTAAGTVLGTSGALQRMTGIDVVTLPWAAIAVLVAGAFLVTGLTSLWTTLAATRANPTSVVGDE